MSLQLPIDALLPEILQTIERNTLTLVEAEPGAGKTTRVPAALLKAGTPVTFVLEPRRLAARLAARRVSEELKTPLGAEVGYQVRYEKVGAAHTRLWFLTEGVLTNRLLTGTQLPQGSIIILDEFHERHLETDLALALLRQLTRQRADLRLVLMSATLGGEHLLERLGDGVPLIRAKGQTFPLNIHYTPHSAQPLEEQVVTAVRQALNMSNGNVLVFLPGAAEIRASMRACETLARFSQVQLAALHGDLSPEEQDVALAPGSDRKIIFSTNVAESSVTVEGVDCVIDSGLARILTHSPWNGLARLQIAKVSRSSCIQRAGRAGRLRAGTVIRLYTQEDFARRPEAVSPELTRADLTQMLLQLASSNRKSEELPWLDSPRPKSLLEARKLLLELGAFDQCEGVTDEGQWMRLAPVHPRLSAMILRAGRYGAGREACKLAALLSSGRTRIPDGSTRQFVSDVDALLTSRHSYVESRLNAHLGELLNRKSVQKVVTSNGLEKALLFAFADRAGRKSGSHLLLANGTSVRADQNSCTVSEFCVALEIDDRDRSAPVARIACPIEPDWLLELFPDEVVVSESLCWSRKDQKVELRQAIQFRQLVLDETFARPACGPAVCDILLTNALNLPSEMAKGDNDISRLLARVDFAAAHESMAEDGQAILSGAIRQLAERAVSLAELKDGIKNGTLLRLMLARLDTKLLDQIAPASLLLPGGRRARIEYSPGKVPCVASRLQDFVGMHSSPSVARGRVPLVLQLLAPNGRPVQVTTDLDSFWKTLYPQLRRELSRRYPRHPWPEAP